MVLLMVGIDVRELPLERVEAELCELAAHMDAGLCRWLVLLGEYDARGGHETWECRSAAMHYAECADPNCDAPWCREGRGLPPLTPEEVEEGRRQARARREQAREERQREEEARRARIEDIRKRAFKGRAYRAPRGKGRHADNGRCDHATD